MKKGFLCGAARADITPAVGTLLYGYNPHQVSTSVHDPLNVTAAAFSDGEETALLVALTVGDLQTELSDELRALIGEACAIPAENVILSGTHTHSAPNVSGDEGWGNVDRPFVDSILIPGLLKAAKDAVAAMKPAVIGVGTAESQVGINRRQICRNGEVCLGQNPFGCYDPTMTCLSIKGEDGAGILNLVHYGCHGTAAGCNHEISRDWSGIMCDRLEKQTGILTAFVNGAEGDVGPRLTNGRTVGDITHVEELGGKATFDALKAYQAIRGYRPGELKLYHGEVRLPYRPLPSLEEIREKLATYTDPDSLINIQRLMYACYRDMEKVLASGKSDLPTHFTFQQTILSLGGVLFIPFPFEMFSATTLRLREYTGFDHTLCLSCSNGFNAYLPSQDQIPLGGYEVACFLYRGAFNLVPDADQHMINEILRILRTGQSANADRP